MKCILIYYNLFYGRGFCFFQLAWLVIWVWWLVLTWSLHSARVWSLVSGDWVPSLVSGAWVPSLVSGAWVLSLVSGARVPSLVSWVRVPSLVSGYWVLSLVNGDWVPSLVTGARVLSFVSGGWVRCLVRGDWVPSLVSGDWVSTLVSGDWVPSLVSGARVPSFVSGGWVLSLVSRARVPSFVGGARIPSLVSGDWIYYYCILSTTSVLFLHLCLSATVTLTCTGCQITANLALQFPIGGVAQAIQLTVQTPAFATASGEMITEVTSTNRYSNMQCKISLWQASHICFICSLAVWCLPPILVKYLARLLHSVCSIFQLR